MRVFVGTIEHPLYRSTTPLSSILLPTRSRITLNSKLETSPWSLVVETLVVLVLLDIVRSSLVHSISSTSRILLATPSPHGKLPWEGERRSGARCRNCRPRLVFSMEMVKSFPVSPMCSLSERATKLSSHCRLLKVSVLQLLRREISDWLKRRLNCFVIVDK